MGTLCYQVRVAVNSKLAAYGMQAARQRLDEYAALSAGRQAVAAAVNGAPAFSHLEDLGRLAADVAVEARNRFVSYCT